MRKDIEFYFILHLFSIVEYVEIIAKLQGKIKANFGSGVRSDPRQICQELDMVIVYASLVAATIWPNIEYGKNRNGYNLRTKRAKQMEGLLGISSDTFPLITDNAFRNDLAHFDERIDEWYSSSENKSMHRYIIESSNGPMMQGVNKMDVFQWFMPDTKVYVIAGKEINMDKLMAECFRIGLSAKKLLEMNGM